jgi:hypothetical protein
MKITPCADIAGLYLVEDVYNTALLDQFLAEDHAVLGTKEALAGQESWCRDCFRSFDSASVWTQLLASVDLSSLSDLTLEPTSTAFWKDYPGFHCGSHTDNALLEASMQVYLADSTDPAMGTTFHPEHTIAYRKNTGYLMINQGQLHGGDIPTQEMRYSTYTWLQLKS